MIFPNANRDVFSVQMSSVDLVREWSREELCLLLDLLPGTKCVT